MIQMRPARWQDAFSIFEKMLDDGIEPNGYTYSALMNACANTRPVRTDKVLELLGKINGDTLSYVQICGQNSLIAFLSTAVQVSNRITLNTALKAFAYSKPPRMDLADDLVKRMDANGVGVDAAGLLALLQCCSYSNPPCAHHAAAYWKKYAPGSRRIRNNLKRELYRAVGSEQGKNLLRQKRRR